MITKPKGTYDILGEDAKKIQQINNLVDYFCEMYNYEYIRTPIFEVTELFHRSVGEETDIVTKETYDFIDRSERELTLRPEGTAGVVRSFIENKMYGDALPKKFYYNGTMYRYERPQSGRFREFYQIGVEVFGSDSPNIDAEVISIPVNFYKLIGLKGIKVNINTLGDKESRENYKEALINHFKPHINNLCSDCQERFLKNPLRILDCKIDASNEIMKTAPKTIDYLNQVSKDHFTKVKEALDALDIDYIVNPGIVRGLDYYTHTVFEVEADIKGFGSNNVLCGGGRYNGLISAIGGPEISGVGFALGLERLLNAINAEAIELPINDTVNAYIIPMSEEEQSYAMGLTQSLRLNGFTVEMDYMSRKLTNNFKQADKLNSEFIIIIGEEEIKNKTLTIKNNKTKEEYKIKETEVIDFLDEFIKGDE
ncbi:MAG: histidine--tRNA ligase [Bacilli bacterium]